jgi:DNA-directed RNA polymerase specialized sigma24 family protein
MNAECFPASEERLKNLWLKALAAHDLAEREPLLWAFRDALHEHIDQCRAENNTKKIRPSLLGTGAIPK